MVHSKYPRRQLVSGDGFIQRRYELLRNKRLFGQKAGMTDILCFTTTTLLSFSFLLMVHVDTTNEPIHPTLSKNPKYYSHKRYSALTHELGMSVYENKLVWTNGPKPASKRGISVCRQKLKNKIPAGKRAIGDNGCRGEPDTVSTPSSHDLPELRLFKCHARARHETFNGRIKKFKCLSERFRHNGIKKHHVCFEAVCVIVQYQMENGSPLFDV